MSVTSNVDFSRIALLEAIRSQGKTWDVLAPRYGVTNPNPPWKTSLTAMCDCLDVSGALGSSVIKCAVLGFWGFPFGWAAVG